MNKIIIGIFLAVVLALSLYAGYMAKYEIPHLENQIYDLENTPESVHIRFLPGKVDTFMVRDTVATSSPDVDTPTQVNADSLKKVFYTDFRDSLLAGRITTTIGPTGRLISNNLDYRLRVPIFRTSRVDTVFTETTRTVVKFKPMAKTRRLQFGLMIGGTLEGAPMLGPSLSFLDRNDNNFGYSYDALQGYHLVTFKRTLRLR